MTRPTAPPLLLLLAALAAAGCGGSAVPCPGVEVDGVCWEARDGISLSGSRVARIAAIARRHWGAGADPEGWTVLFVRSAEVHVDHDPTGASVVHRVDGIDYHGWACPQHRLIVVRPFDGADCIERSVVFHELGHAWGAREGDPRLYAGYDLMREAMEGSRWQGCLGDDDRDVGADDR